MNKSTVGRGVPDAPLHECGGSGSPALPCRKRLPHTAPICVDVRNAIYFITICAADRANANWVGLGVPDAPLRECDGSGSPDQPLPPAATIINAAKHYHHIGKWFVHLMLVMPDHIHALISFGGASGTPRPTDDIFGASGTPRPTMMASIGQWKSYVAKVAGIRFQRDFWDTRIRDASHFAERFDYIMKNPVRRGLSSAPEEWAWKFRGETP